MSRLDQMTEELLGEALGKLMERDKRVSNLIQVVQYNEKQVGKSAELNALIFANRGDIFLQKFAEHCAPFMAAADEFRIHRTTLLGELASKQQDMSRQQQTRQSRAAKVNWRQSLVTACLCAATTALSLAFLLPRMH